LKFFIIFFLELYIHINTFLTPVKRNRKSKENQKRRKEEKKMRRRGVT